MEKLNAFLFDVDGVLVESDKANFISLNRALNKNFGISITEQDDLSLGPIPSFVKLQHLRNKFNFSVSSEQESTFLRDKFDFLMDEIKAGTVKYNDNVFNIFKFIKATGLKTGVVSNARVEYISIIIEGLGISNLVDVFVGNNMGLKPKPYPDMYLHAMESIEVKPNNCVIFEDSDVGIAAAAASGALVYRINDFSSLSLDLIESIYENFSKPNFVF